MVTYLSALRFAVNLEHSLQELQKRRFVLTGDTGARALPPLIPLARHPDAPGFARLDQIRRFHAVTLPKMDGEGEGCPPARIALTDQGESNQIERQIISLQRVLEPSGIAPEFPPEIVLSWQSQEALPCSVALPETSAFWLSVFQLEPGEDLWWEYLTWTELYRRRLRTQSH